MTGRIEKSVFIRNHRNHFSPKPAQRTTESASQIFIVAFEGTWSIDNDNPPRIISAIRQREDKYLLNCPESHRLCEMVG